MIYVICPLVDFTQPGPLLPVQICVLRLMTNVIFSPDLLYYLEILNHSCARADQT